MVMTSESNLLKQKIWALAAYKNASRVMLSAKTPQELIEGVCQGITHQNPFVLSWVGLKEDDPKKTIVVAGVSGIAKSYVENIKVSWDENMPEGLGPTGQCIRSKKSIVIPNIETEPKFQPWLIKAQKHHIMSVIALPITDGHELYGALMVYGSIPEAFGEQETSLFESLAEEIFFALKAFRRDDLFEIEQAKRNILEQQIEKTLELTIEALVTALDSRDPYTAGHQMRVADIAVAIAKELKWEEGKIIGLRKAALVHDIGKISVPAELLTKPTQLSPAERALINEHAEHGYQILKEIPFTNPVALTVRQHHERLDGSGYPAGLKGNEIIPEARVLAVADSIEAMSTNRPYRYAVSLKETMAKINRDAGIKLDAEVVSAANQLHSSGKLQKLINSQPRQGIQLY
jgi:putative nucleotidyltransferase with HDIG domain